MKKEINKNTTIEKRDENETKMIEGVIKELKNKFQGEKKFVIDLKKDIEKYVGTERNLSEE